MNINSYKINIDGIEIEIEKKNIKNMYLYVKYPNGKVKVTAPQKVKDEAIQSFILSKLTWIKKQRNKFNMKECQGKMEFKSGESIYYKGDKYLLNIIYTNKKQSVEIRNQNYIDLYVHKESTKEQREKVIIEWYRKQLKSQISDIIKKWEKVMGVKIKSWGVKRMKTRWGTCNPSAKRIWINLELAKKKPICLEYIIVHEMVHLFEIHHNKRFFSYMDKFLPDWRKIKNELNNLKFQ